jgi:hypothetical protein
MVRVPMYRFDRTNKVTVCIMIASPISLTGAKIMQLNEKLTSLSSTMETPQPSRNHEYRLKQLEESTDKPGI